MNARSLNQLKDEWKALFLKTCLGDKIKFIGLIKDLYFKNLGFDFNEHELIQSNFLVHDELKANYLAEIAAIDNALNQDANQKQQNKNLIANNYAKKLNQYNTNFNCLVNQQTKDALKEFLVDAYANFVERKLNPKNGKEYINYYKILGLPPNASEKDIKMAQVQFHPDKVKLDDKYKREFNNDKDDILKHFLKEIAAEVFKLYISDAVKTLLNDADVKKTIIDLFYPAAILEKKLEPKISSSEYRMFQSNTTSTNTTASSNSQKPSNPQEAEKIKLKEFLMCNILKMIHRLSLETKPPNVMTLDKVHQTFTAFIDHEKLKNVMQIFQLDFKKICIELLQQGMINCLSYSLMGEQPDYEIDLNDTVSITDAGAKELNRLVQQFAPSKSKRESPSTPNEDEASRAKQARSSNYASKLDLNELNEFEHWFVDTLYKYNNIGQRTYNQQIFGIYHALHGDVPSPKILALIDDALERLNGTWLIYKKIKSSPSGMKEITLTDSAIELIKSASAKPRSMP